jgi:hypothetical protein
LSWSWRCRSYNERNEEEVVVDAKKRYPTLDDVELPPAKAVAHRLKKSDLDPIQREKGGSLETNMNSTRFDNVFDNLRGLFSTPSPMKGEDPDVYAELYGRVDAALDLNRELEKFDRTKDRSVLIKALRDRFLITRYDSATLVEKCKLAALEILIGRMPKMSDNRLIKTMETLYQIGAMDITSITGSGQVKR